MPYIAYDNTGTQTGASSSSGGGGGGPTGSRTILDMGGNAHASQAANSLWTYEWSQVDEGSTNSASVRPHPVAHRLPFAFTITGWCLTQYRATGTQQFQLCRNRTAGALGNFVTVNAGNATVAGFPGQQFSSTFPSGLYNFTSADWLSAVGQNGTAGANDVHLQLTIEWL